jgi:ribosomal protein S5
MTTMWDGYGELVTKPENIIPAIKKPAANGKPSLINVEVNHESLRPFIAGTKNAVNVILTAEIIHQS